jgi:hypothetical protein
MSMDALCPAGMRRFHTGTRISLLAAMAVCLTTATTEGAVFQTKNFTIHAPTASIAKQVGETAEVWRKRLAREWLGKEMPQWYQPCPVHVKVGQIGAGGATTFSFDRGQVFGWNMRVQGTLERILDSVIPHEVSHTVLACHFRRPLPRWADEGAATLVEHESEQRVQQMRLRQVIGTRQRIPLRRLLAMKDYPRDMHQVLVLYAEGYSLADFLVQQKGKPTYLKFLDNAYRNGWDVALKRHYEFDGVERLEKDWTGWIMAGSPRINLPKGQALAAQEPAAKRARPGVVRSQSPENSDDSPVAPAPRRIGHHTGTKPEPRDFAKSLASRAESLESEGRLRALNDGWVPIIRKSRSTLRLAQNTTDDNRNGSFDDADETGGRKRKAPPAGGRQHPRDPQSDWSRFPHAGPVERP